MPALGDCRKSLSCDCLRAPESRSRKNAYDRHHRQPKTHLCSPLRRRRCDCMEGRNWLKSVDPGCAECNAVITEDRPLQPPGLTGIPSAMISLATMPVAELDRLS